jgi:hypothetical protein
MALVSSPGVWLTQIWRDCEGGPLAAPLRPALPDSSNSGCPRRHTTRIVQDQNFCFPDTVRMTVETKDHGRVGEATKNLLPLISIGERFKRKP